MFSASDKSSTYFVEWEEKKCFIRLSCSRVIARLRSAQCVCFECCKQRIRSLKHNVRCIALCVCVCMCNTSNDVCAVVLFQYSHATYNPKRLRKTAKQNDEDQQFKCVSVANQRIANRSIRMVIVSIVFVRVSMTMCYTFGVYCRLAPANRCAVCLSISIAFPFILIF